MLKVAERPLTAVRNRRDWLVDLAKTSLRRFRRSDSSVGYIGWTVAENLGDEVMLQSAHLLLTGSNVEVFTGVRREAALARIGLSGSRTFDRVFLGGGTLINEGYLGIVRRALDFGIPVSSLGTGVGSSGFGSTCEDVSLEWRDALSQFRRLGVRGPHSKSKLEAIGLKNAEVIGDLALALTPETPTRNLQARRFIFNVAAPSAADRDFPTDKLFEEFGRAARRLSDLGWEPIPVAFCEEDVAPIATVLRNAGMSVDRIELPKNAAAFFALAAGACMSLGVRLHCAVLSCCAGIAPLAVAYRGKGRDFAASVGLGEWMLDLDQLTGDAFAARAEDLAVRAEEIGTRAHSEARRWREALMGYVLDA